MDEPLRDKSLVAFVFGPAVARDPHSHESVKRVARRAYRDLARTLAGMGKHPKADELKQDMYEKIADFVSKLSSLGNKETFDREHQQWCTAAVNDFNNQANKSGHKITFTYGHAQKWLNMTLKYLAVLNHPDIEHVYRHLHVPIDRIVLYEMKREKILAKSLPAWSKIEDSKTYVELQESLRAHADQEELECAMDWEAGAWVDRGTEETESS